MKKSAALFFAISMCVSNVIMADTLRLDDTVVLKNDTPGLTDVTMATAFRSTWGCQIWNYIPGGHFATGNFSHLTSMNAVKIGATPQLGLLSTLQVNTTTGLTPELLNKLRAEIFAKLKNTTGECAGTATSPENIFLSPALVKTLDAKGEAITSEGASPYFLSIKPANYSPGTGAYFDPTNPSTTSLIFDATSTDTMNNLQLMQTQSLNAPTRVGNIIYNIEGVSSVVEASINIKGKFSAQFNSHIENTKCNVNTSEKNLSPTMGAGMIAGNGLSGPGIGYSEKKVTCEYNLVTEMTAGAYKSLVTLDLTKAQTKTADGQDLMVNTCDEEADCYTVPMASFLEHKLFTLLLLQNFDVIITKLANGTFDITLGRRGAVNSDFDVTAVFKQRFDDDIGYSVPLYVHNLSASSFDFTKFSSPLFVCAQEYYSSQLLKYLEYKDQSPMPIATECLGGGQNVPAVNP